MLVGMLLGSLQTGLYFQLSFTLSSSFRKFLTVTVCWLIGSAIGVWLGKHTNVPLNLFLLVAILMYFSCALVLAAAPFDTSLWLVYAVFIVLIGLYPSVFFVRQNRYYRARDLFFRENNGFIAGIVCATLLFLLSGRLALWITPSLIAGATLACTAFLTESRQGRG
jgi:hypothetical protein